MSIDSAILQVSADMTPIQKKYIKQLGYSAMLFEHLVESIRPIMIRHNLRLSLTELDILSDTNYTTANNKTGRHVTLSCTFTVTYSGGDEPEVRHIQTIGECMDLSDKACGKAITYATKYAYRQMFMLVYDDDDPDRSHPERAGSSVTKERALVKIREASNPESLDKIKSHVLNPSSATFTAAAVEELVAAIDERRKSLEATQASDPGSDVDTPEAG